MLISFSLPSMRPLTEVQHCIKQIYANATTPQDIEVVVRIDHEAHRDDSFVEGIKGSADDVMGDGSLRDNIVVLHGPRMYGYCSGPEMNKEIIEVMRGEFLFIYNDDVKNISPGYDDLIRKYTGKLVVITTNTPGNVHDFGVWSKKFLEVNGRLGYGCYTNWDLDCWDKYCPQVVQYENDLEIDHKPSAGHGKTVSLGLECEYLHKQDGYSEYPWSRLHLGLDGEVRTSDDQPKGLNKWVKIAKVDIPNIGC